jgi:hypothetical protein
LYAAGKPTTFSALSGSFREYGTPTANPDQGDIVVFSKYGEPGKKGFGHVGFFVKRESNSIVILGGNQVGDTGSTGAIVEATFPEKGRDLYLIGFRKVVG